MKTTILIRVALAGTAALLSAQALRADLIEQITLTTAPLIGAAAGPFSLDFQLNGGNGNTATLSGFTFGAGGAASGTPTLTGGATGDLSSSVTLTETGFLNEFTQTFTPGSQLTFQLDLTTKTSSMGFPDEFAFAILDHTGADLPTTGPFDVFTDVLITPSPTVSTYGSDPSRAPAGGGGPLNIGPPITATPSSAVPEPAALGLLAAGLGAVSLLRRRR
jgi:hypothetical protein